MGLDEVVGLWQEQTYGSDANFIGLRPKGAFGINCDQADHNPRVGFSWQLNLLGGNPWLSAFLVQEGHSWAYAQRFLAALNGRISPRFDTLPASLWGSRANHGAEILCASSPARWVANKSVGHCTK